MPSLSMEKPLQLQNPPLHHPHHFKFESAREVPDSHVWPTVDDHPSVDSSGPDSVPVIDISSVDAVSLISQACESWGVFQITGHGIDLRLLDGFESEVRRLFDLPTELKLKVGRTQSGLSGYGLAPISSFFSKLMWSEGFTISGSPLEHARRLWPKDYMHFWYVQDFDHKPS